MTLAEFNTNLINQGKVLPVIDEKLCCYDSVNNKKIFNCQSVDNTIQGFDDEGNKARYSLRLEQWLYGQDIKKDNLIPFDYRNTEDIRYISSLGVEVSKQRREQKKNINELAKEMLERTLSDKAIDQVLGEGVEMLEDKSIASVMVAKMIQTALAGSFKAFETVRDTAGYKPRNEIEINGEIMTDSDRALIDKLTARTSKTG